MTLAKAGANKTFIVQASLTIVTDDCQNIFCAIGVVTDNKSSWIQIYWNSGTDIYT